MLGDLAISDARIQSLIREKDAEILKLRDRIFAIEKSKVSGASSESANKIIEVLREENVKLKNTISQLQTEHGSAELVASLRAENLELEQRNLQLEQENSNLTTDLFNLKREFEVKLSVFGENAKLSNITSG
jgi:cell division protein FtsB